MKKGILILAFLLVSSVQAADSSSGCGMGWYVTQKNSLVSSFVRALTNATFLNSFAMTSGTSNCQKHDLVKKDKMPTHFAETNFDVLVTQMSQGKGEVLNNFANVMGCKESGVSDFNQMSQKGIQKLYELGSPSPQDLVQAVRVQMILNPKVARACGETA